MPSNLINRRDRIMTFCHFLNLPVEELFIDSDAMGHITLKIELPRDSTMIVTLWPKSLGKNDIAWIIDDDEKEISHGYLSSLLVVIEQLSMQRNEPDNIIQFDR